MGTTFRPYSPSQMPLLPPDLGEWLPEGHLAYHVSDIVDALDLRAFDAPYEGGGRRKSPYEFGMMVKILVYAYATGVFSSCRISRKLEEDFAFRVFAAGNSRSTGRSASSVGDTWRILSGCLWTLSGLPARWGLRTSGSCPSTARRCGRTRASASRCAMTG